MRMPNKSSVPFAGPVMSHIYVHKTITSTTTTTHLCQYCRSQPVLTNLCWYYIMTHTHTHTHTHYTDTYTLSLYVIHSLIHTGETAVQIVPNTIERGYHIDVWLLALHLGFASRVVLPQNVSHCAQILQCKVLRMTSANRARSLVKDPVSKRGA